MSFEARYAGQCGACDERIRVGDLVTYEGAALLHADCEEAQGAERKADICGTCWLAKPCDCEANA